MPKHILVTGSHRSGTTWAGKMITLSPDVLYIHEPLNKKINKCEYCGLNINCSFLYIYGDNSEHHKNHIEHTLRFQHNHIANIKSILSFKNIRRAIELYSEYFKSKNKDLLIKDPYALLSADWLAKTFDMDVIVLIRHPLAFIASIKVKNWQFNFNDLLDQQELMKTKLKSFEKEIREYSKNKPDIIDQGILLWNILHTVIKDY